MKLRIGLVFLVCMLLGQAAFAQDLVMFSYQGRVKVHGQAFTGNGKFKFAIVNTSGNTTLWSNDGTSTGGQFPTDSLTVAVQDGVFDVMIGDTSLGMQAINRSIFNSNTPLKLRTWFSDGTNPFERLQPDNNLANISLVGTDTVDYHLYVSPTGDDVNSGLTTDTAKRTIQAAIDTVPPRLRCNVTVKILPGVYREQVNVYGISSPTMTWWPSELLGKKLVILGDENWTPASASEPNVRVTGTDVDTATPVRVRDFCLLGKQSSTVVVQGVLFDQAKRNAVLLDGGDYTLKNCKLSSSPIGLLSILAHMAAVNVVASNNDYHGMQIMRASHMDLTDCRCNNNGDTGLLCASHSDVIMYGTPQFNGNLGTGIYVQMQAIVQAISSAQIKSNNVGVCVADDSYLAGLPTAPNISGNTLDTRLARGGKFY